MRHYELVILIHPDQSEQLTGMLDRYHSTIKKNNGVVHRFENWGRRPLAYPINKIHKAFYILMNIECENQTIDELINTFRFNDAVLRHVLIRRKEAVTEPSPLSKEYERQDDSSSARRNTQDLKKPKEEKEQNEKEQSAEPLTENIENDETQE